MNFEQNFSPLDPNSEEYQSIGEEYLQIVPSVGGETEKRKEEKPITLKDLGLQKPVSAKKEIGLNGIEVTKLDDKAILAARESQIELENTYNNVVKAGTDYLNGIVQSIKQEKPEAQPLVSEFLREQASLNTPEQLKQRVDRSWEFLSSVSDIDTNNTTRNAWLNSQYAGAYYSKSKAIKDEYEASDLKDKISQKQYSGLRSLLYGKKSDFNDFINVLQDDKASQAEKDLVLAKLDKISSNIDMAAGSAMGRDGGKEGIILFNDAKIGAQDADNKLVQIEYDNPFTIQSFKDIAGRAIERGLYSAEGADILTVTSENTGIPFERLAEINRLQQEAKQSKAYEEFQKDKSFENFMKNPFGIMAEVTLESLVAMYRHGASRMAAGMAEGALMGSVIPVIGTAAGASAGMIAGSGLTSLNLEYSSKILETLSENGVDITNAQDLKDAFSNQELMDKARLDGWKKGVPVSLFDMLSAGIAGKFVSKSAKSIMTTTAPTLGRKVFGGVAELGAQAALGGAGEAAGQIVEKGGIYDVNGIVMEMLGEPFGSVGEIVTGRAFEMAKRNEPLKTRDIVDIISKNDKSFINNNIDAHLAAGVINQEQADALKNQIAYTEGMSKKLPSGLSSNGKADIIDLLGKRDNIISSVETLDDVFKKKANEQVRGINEQILNIYNSEQNATKESTGQEQISPKQSGVSQYQGVEGEQTQATTEADNRNSIIGSKAQFQVGKQDVGVYKKETSAITNKINEIGGSAIELTTDDAINATSQSSVSLLNGREGIVKQPNVVKINDFSGIPMMVTISDELTTGSITNPATGNVISDLNGGVGFNYSEGNTDLAWAYTDLDTATDTLNNAKDIYQNNKELFDKLWASGKLPQNHIPVAVVKMGTEAINSNEAVFRVFADNLQSLPAKNLKNAYNELVKDIESNYNRLNELSKKKKLSPSERNALNGFEQIKNEYLKKNKSMLDVVSNVSQLNINTRPLITDRISSGEVGLLPAENRLKADKPVTKALMEGLPKSDIKKIHLGYIAEPLRDEAIKNVPARHIISFVGIDISKDAPVQTGNHKNYPYALSGQGLGVVENTAHISSVMPTAYGNIVSKITDVVAKEGSITPSQAVSRALPSGLSNLIFRNKTLATNDNISKLIGFLNLSFPNVTFFTDKQSFEDVLSSEGVKEYLKDGDVVYGITKDGNIYLNPDKATYNTAIHEMGHIWVDFIENTKPELFSQGLKLVEGTKEFEDARARLGDNVFARKEALAALIGNKGETIADAAMKSQFKEWLVGVWKYLQEVFPSLRKLTPEQIQNLSLQDFLGGALQDILSGKPISTKKEEYTAAESQFQKDIVPTGGVPSVPGENGLEGASETGLPKKKQYDWEKTSSTKTDEGETMIKTSTGRYVAVETMAGQQQERKRVLNEMKRLIPSFLKSFYEKSKLTMIDNQQTVLDLLSKIGKEGMLMKSYLLTRNSASSTSAQLLEKALDTIYGDISKRKKFNINGAKFTEYELFNQIIGYQRVISIQNQMDELFQNMKKEWNKIKPQYDEIQSTSDKINKLKNIISSQEFKSLSREQKNAIVAKMESLKSDLESMRTAFDEDSRDYNKSKKRLIENNMIDEKGDYIGENLDIEFARGQVTATQARALLNETRDAIGEESFDKLMNKSTMYSDYMNSLFKKRMEAGIISKDTYDYLSRFFYAPTKYVSDVILDPILSLTSKTVSFKKENTLKMKSLSGGRENMTYDDYEEHLRSVTYASEYTIAENRATGRFYDLISENSDKFEEYSIRLGVKLEKVSVEEKDVIDESMNRLSEASVNEKKLPSGQKSIEYKGISKTKTELVKPEDIKNKIYTPVSDIIIDDNGNKVRIVQVPLKQGEDYIKTYRDGQRYDIIVPEWFAEQWYNKNVLNSQTASFIGKVTGSNLVRLLATGVNPVFGIAQIVLDSKTAYMMTIGTRKNRILLIDYPVFFGKILSAYSDIKNKTSTYNDAVKYGATTNFYNGGMISFEKGITGKSNRSLEDVLENWRIPFLSWYVKVSKKISETTEQMSKVAIYKYVIKDNIDKFVKENGREPVGIELDDLKIESAAIARSTADFHRKGTAGGDINKVLPYLNAGTQIKRGFVKSASENKGKFLWNVLQFIGIGSLITLQAIGFDDDDELKERKRQAYLALPEHDRDNRLLLYYVDKPDTKEKDGTIVKNGHFVSVKLPSELVPFHSLQRRMVERVYLENKTLNQEDIKEILKNTSDAIPLAEFMNLDKQLSRNAGYSFTRKLFFNRDPYRQEDIVAYEKSKYDYLEGAEPGKEQATKISQFIGKAAVGLPFLPEGISPKRLDAAANSIPFQSNPLSGNAIMLAQMFTSEKEVFEEKYGKNTIDKVLKASGITERYFKKGSKINQNIISLPLNEVKDRNEFKNKVAENLLPKFEALSQSMTKEEAFIKVSDDFIKNEFKNLDNEQKQIAQEYIIGSLRPLVKVKTKDATVNQIIKMEGGDPKIDAIIYTLNNVKQTEKSRDQFLQDLVDNGITSDVSFGRRLASRGLETILNPETNVEEKNPFYEKEVGKIYKKMTAMFEKANN